MAGTLAPLRDTAPVFEWPPGNKEEEAVHRILSSRQFAKAPLLSSFLAYVCRRALEDGQLRITEHEIAGNVFGRAVNFDPSSDNIVRTYARHLRKRLEEYYAGEGKSDELRIEIPKGGYKPEFSAKKMLASGSEPSPNALSKEATQRTIRPGYGARILRPALSIRLALVFALCALIFLFGVRAVQQRSIKASHISPMHPLWIDLFGRDRDTYIVPGDIGFVILQQVNRKSFSLNEYLKWNSASIAADHISMSYLEDEAYTSVLNLKIISSLQKLPEEIPDRFVIRAARNVRFDDLRDGNAILLGSNYSNPWDDLFSGRLNFHFMNHPAADRYWIMNRQPRPGEQPLYEPQATAAFHRTYAVIAFLPNLNGTGHVLLLQGLDAAGTQAAADMLLRRDALQSILGHAKTADGHFRSFEVLIEATSLDANSQVTDSHVVASRF